MSEAASFKILIVDDDPRFRSSLVRLLRTLDLRGESCETVEAESGAEALAYVTEHPLDCVLTDNCMPGGNGVDWIERILQARPTVALIMMTGNGDENTAVTAMKRGAIDYLTKGSITPATLTRTIGNAVEKQRLRNAVEQQRGELIKAERQRVMFESIGAACHHLGQPVTVLSTYLQLMQMQEKDPALLEMVNSAMDSVSSITDILERLRRVNAYQTEPYLSVSDLNPSRTDERILAI